MSAENEPIVALESTADSEATENPNGDIDGAVEQQADVNHDEQNGHGVAADARAQGTSGTATVVVDEPPEKNADSAPPAVKRRKGSVPPSAPCGTLVFTACPSGTKVPGANPTSLLQHEAAYLRNLPGAKCYEKSFMHREMITHVLATCTDFIITVSCDGHLKFWKKQHGEGVEFVKHFRAHVGQIVHVHQNWNGTLLCTAGVDKTVKVFDIANFDMITMIRLDYEPLACAWVHHPSDAISALAVSESSSGKVHVYDGRGAGAVALHTFDKLHSKPVMLMQFNAVLDCAISIDQLGMIEYWTGPKYDYEFPKTVQFEYKTDTDLYTFAKEKVSPVCVAISPTGKHFGTWASDKKIRIFNFVTGKMTKVIDESINSYENDKSNYQDLPHTEIGRRLAVEKDLDQSKFARYATLCFDESGHFLIYPSIIGIKVVNLTTNQCVRVIGKGETLRFVSVALCRAVPGPAERLHGVAPTMEAEASDNPALKHSQPDPMLVCSAYKRARFYLFTNTEPFGAAGDDQGAAAAQDRDVFNEKPLKTDIITSFESAASDRKLTDTCVLHTSYGDIHCKLFMRQTPKTVENFVTHARRGYYNGVVFHRIINKFMIQTGDPTGTGTGGESIWGGEFGDEIVPELKHDLPYTISMANAGPNTNGSQFFITVIPCPWLDGKHTVFGRVFRGMEVVQTISKVPANSKTGKPREDISVVSITLK